MFVRSDPLLLQSWQTAFRSATLDMQQVERVAEGAAHYEKDFLTFTPTTAQIDAMDKFSRRGFQCWRGADKDRKREGELPFFSQLIYDNALPDKPIQQIEYEGRTIARRIDARINSKECVVGLCR